MSQEVSAGTETQRDTTVSTTRLTAWQAGVLAGLAGSLGMGVVMTAMAPQVMAMAIPALYGLQGGVVGWSFHMAHGAVIGVAFAALVERTDIGKYATATGRHLLIGGLYGAVVWVALAVIVMPIWLSGVGFAGAPPLPNVNVGSLLMHLVYGVIVGVFYPVVR
ncbi:MAG: histidine kinase [Halobacteriales archaeon]|nr:histidine kinase [Halobacteriales archaeon]